MPNEKGVTDEGVLFAKLTEVEQSSEGEKKMPTGDVAEKMMNEIKQQHAEKNNAVTDAEIISGEENNLPDTEPENFGDEHSNKKTESNPRGAGRPTYNDECSCAKCRWIRAHEEKEEEKAGALIPDNVDVICVAENKFILSPAEKIFGMKPGELQITSEEQEFCNMFKPEDTEIKRSWKVYFVINGLTVISKAMVVITKWFVKPLARFREPEKKVT